MPSPKADCRDSQQNINSYTSIHASIAQLKSKKAELDDYFRTEAIKLDSKIRTLESALQVIIGDV